MYICIPVIIARYVCPIDVQLVLIGVSCCSFFNVYVEGVVFIAK